MKSNYTSVSVLPAVSVAVHCEEPSSPHRALVLPVTHTPYCHSGEQPSLWKHPGKEWENTIPLTNISVLTSTCVVTRLWILLTLCPSWQEDPKSTILMADLLGLHSRMFSGFRSQWMIDSSGVARNNNALHKKDIIIIFLIRSTF